MGIWGFIGRWMPDDETKSKIGMYTSKFAKNAGRYVLRKGCKFTPGAAALYKILSQTIKDVKSENRKLEKLKVPEENVGGRKLTAGADMHGGGGVETIDKSPEDMIRIFMMKEFSGTRYLDGLMVQESARGKGKKPE